MKKSEVSYAREDSGVTPIASRSTFALAAICRLAEKAGYGTPKRLVFEEGVVAIEKKEGKHYAFRVIL